MCRWTPQRWQQAQDILDRLDDLPSIQQPACLDRHGPDPELRRDIERALRHRERIDTLLDRPPMPTSQHADLLQKPGRGRAGRTSSSVGELTHPPGAQSEGDTQAFDDIMSLAADDLRRIAEGCLRRHSVDGMQGTELVDEIYEDLDAKRRVHWQDRKQLYQFAALLMERVLLESRRGTGFKKRKGSESEQVLFQVPTKGLSDGPSGPGEAMMGFHHKDVLEVIERLEQLNPMQAMIVRMRYFMGLTFDETAEALEVSRRTVHRGWRRARDFLSIELAAYESDEPPDA